jgi:hypothetical protein
METLFSLSFAVYEDDENDHISVITFEFYVLFIVSMRKIFLAILSIYCSTTLGGELKFQICMLLWFLF